jgi:hypothetical protein
VSKHQAPTLNLEVALKKLEACDSCGYWRGDPELIRNTNRDGISWPLYVTASHIADAKYEIIIEKRGLDGSKKRSVFLCGHHYTKHEAHIAVKGYEVQELIQK